MICQKCGKAISLKQTYVVQFRGSFITVSAKWIACKKCAQRVHNDAVKYFGIGVCQNHLNVYQAKKGGK